MNSLILQYGARSLHPILLIISLLVLYRGHNAPGGGFIGGLLAASAYVLYGVAFNLKEARAKLQVEPIILVATGLILALLSGILGMLFNRVFLAGQWITVLTIKLGTPLLFDVGVYLVVIGILLTIMFSLMEE
jgi:multicomponent Na+:H+ antiporter subunit B